MDTKLHLKEAKNSDFEITYRIKCKSIKSYVEKIWDWDEVNQREIHRRKYIPSETKLIEYNNHTIGYVVLKETEAEIHLKNLLIEKEFQNKGIGKEVMEKIIEKADSDKKLVRLQVFKINSKAQKFYHNLGFEITSETENHFEMEKNWLS
jgi:ribosomal protein S18 acetylase RimI-like enzyme